MVTYRLSVMNHVRFSRQVRYFEVDIGRDMNGIQPQRFLPLFLGLIAPTSGFLVLCVTITQNATLGFDLPVLVALHKLRTPALDQVAVVVTFFGSGGLMALSGAALATVLLSRGERKKAAFVAVSTIGAGLFDLLAKVWFARDRPHLWTSAVTEIGYSFPSGHAMGSMSMVAVLVMLASSSSRRGAILVLGGLFVMLIGLSRLYLGVHYPSDVLAGWCAALAWVNAVRLVWKPNDLESKI